MSANASLMNISAHSFQIVTCVESESSPILIRPHFSLGITKGIHKIVVATTPNLAGKTKYWPRIVHPWDHILFQK